MPGSKYYVYSNESVFFANGLSGMQNHKKWLLALLSGISINDLQKC